MSNLVLYEIDHSVAVITLNRPERMNAMDQPMLQQMMDLANRAELDNNVPVSYTHLTLPTILLV